MKSFFNETINFLFIKFWAGPLSFVSCPDCISSTNVVEMLFKHLDEKLRALENHVLVNMLLYKFKSLC